MADRTFVPLDKPRKRIVDRKRVEAARLPFCELCGKTGRPMHIHHHKRRSAGGDDVSENLCNLCWECHGLVHAGRIGNDVIQRVIDARTLSRVAD